MKSTLPIYFAAFLKTCTMINPCSWLQNDMINPQPTIPCRQDNLLPGLSLKSQSSCNSLSPFLPIIINNNFRQMPGTAYDMNPSHQFLAISGAETMACHAFSVNSLWLIRLPPDPEAAAATVARPRLKGLLFYFLLPIISGSVLLHNIHLGATAYL